MTASEALQDCVDIRRKIFGQSDNTEIPNVMFKWDSLQTKHQIQTHRHMHPRTHKHTQTSHTCMQTPTHTHIHATTRKPHTHTTPLRHLPSVLNVKVI